MIKLKTTIASGLTALVLASGCATTLPKVDNGKLLTHQNSIISSIDDSHDYLRFLKEDEYVVPDKILRAYRKTVDKRLSSIPYAVYLKKNFLDTNDEKKEFIGRLKNMGLNEEEVAVYSTIFTSLDVIVITKSTLEGTFEKVLPHERFHKKMNELNDEDYGNMIKVAREMKVKLYPKQEEGVCVDSRNWCYIATVLDPEEFFPYLAQGEYLPKVEEMVKADYPEVYKLFDKIRDECKLKEDLQAGLLHNDN